MGECLVTIPLSEYKRLRDVDTRVRVLLEHAGHYEHVYLEDMYLILGMNEDADMEKEKREKAVEELFPQKEIEVIGA